MKSCWVIHVVLFGDVCNIGSRLVSLNIASIIFQFQRIAINAAIILKHVRNIGWIKQPRLV